MIDNVLFKVNGKPGFVLVLMVACILGIAACKKNDSDGATLPIEGRWRALDSAATAYLIFDKGTVTYLQRGNYNIHDLAKGAYAADAETVTYGSSSSPQLYNYKVSNDTLYLSNTSSYTILVRDNSVNADTWVKYVNVVQSYSLPTGLWFGSMDYSGTDFLISSTFANKLYRADVVSSSVTDSAAMPLNAVGLAVTTGGNVWVNNYGADTKLHRVNPATGATLFSSSNAPDAPVIMAADGNLIWYFSASGLYTYNTLTDVFTLKKTMAGFLTTVSSVNPDMVIKDGYAYIVVYNYLLKFNLTTGLVEDSYKFKDTYYRIGIASDGADMYVLKLLAVSSLANLQIGIDKVQL